MEKGLPFASVWSVGNSAQTGVEDVLELRILVGGPLVEDEDGVRRLVPTAAELIEEIDRAARRIVVVDLPGLLDPS